jgi:hypothetical protein
MPQEGCVDGTLFRGDSGADVEGGKSNDVDCWILKDCLKETLDGDLQG